MALTRTFFALCLPILVVKKAFATGEDDSKLAKATYKNFNFSAVTLLLNEDGMVRDDVTPLCRCAVHSYRSLLPRCLSLKITDWIKQSRWRCLWRSVSNRFESNQGGVHQ